MEATGERPPPGDGAGGVDELLEGSIIASRWLVFALVLAFMLVGDLASAGTAGAAVVLLGAGNLALTMAWLRRRQVPAVQRILPPASIVLDVLVGAGLAWASSFSGESGLFAVLYLLPLEGAARWRMRGAVGLTGVVVALYVGHQVWQSSAPAQDVPWASVLFQAAIAGVVACCVGAMAWRYEREHRRVLHLYHAEREAAELLRRIDSLKSTFLSAVSHELRTPLTSILGFGMTIQHRAGELSPQTRLLVDQLVAESLRLDALLDELLDLDRLATGRMDLQRSTQELHVLVQQVATAVARREGRVIAVDVQPLVAELDRPKVERILENLLANAARYTPAPSSIVVRGRRVDGDGLLLSVDDDGPGVPEEMREVVFQPFERGDQLLAHAPGTGIGLALVERLSQLHGGRAWVERSDSGGASFRVYLPQVVRDYGGDEPARTGPADGPGDAAASAASDQ